MRSGRAEPTLRGWVAAGVATVLLTLTGCAGNASIPPPAPASDSISSRGVQAATTIDALLGALSSGDVAAASQLGTPAARGLVGSLAENVRSLHLVDLSLRYVDEDAAVSPPDAAGPGAWTGTVEVIYRLRDWDDAPITVETPVTFVPGAHGQLIAGIGGSDGRTPVWMTGPVQALVAGRTLVIAQDGQGARDSLLAQRAIRAVDQVLPRWGGKLVVEAPATETGLDQALGAPQAQYADIAAVTGSVDGSLDRTSPVHVFLNPRVFDALGPRGAQVVISHESTHVATHATFATMPTWMIEGFADYVALAHAGIPVATAASQILARVRKQGPPDHLPTTAELAPTASDLGATYEEAWLANRFIAREHGEAKLVAFYYAVDNGMAVGEAFRRVLGTTEAAFVKRWQVDLRHLVKGMAG
ncbi:MAG: hypothetical protein JWQ32_702 [Marmoricola sp.]|nr:hypothetical protein [Marmoricola sp.]